MNRPTLPPYILFVGIGILALLIILSALRSTDLSSKTSAVVASSTPTSLLLKPLLHGLEDSGQIIPPGQELHDFQPAPSAVHLAQSAKLVVGIGGADEQWLSDLLAMRDTPPTTVSLTTILESQGYPLLKEEEHGEIGVDPHVWLSPKLALAILPTLSNALIEVYPTKQVAIERNTAQFTAELHQLDSDIVTTLKSLPQHRFISFHNAFSYFAQDYGLEQVAVIEAVPGEAPTPGEIAAIQDAVRTYKLRGLFVEPQFSSALVEQLSLDQGLVIETLDPLETAKPTDTYIELMRMNLAAFARVLGSD